MNSSQSGGEEIVKNLMLNKGHIAGSTKNGCYYPYYHFIMITIVKLPEESCYISILNCIAQKYQVELYQMAISAHLKSQTEAILCRVA